MRKTIRKVFWVWNFDKEEQWLNEMAEKGLCLVSVGFCRYDFEECTPGAYQICMQMLDKQLSRAESENYIAFLEETGAEHVGNYMKWIYLRRKTELGPFALFSDNASRVKHLTQIIRLVLWIGIMNVIIGAYNLILLPILTQYVNGFSTINLILGIWMLYGAWKLSKKQKQIRKDGQLFE